MEGMDSSAESEASSSAPIDLTPPPSQKQNLSSIHYLPCSIKFDGPTDVNSYFRIKEEAQGGELVSHLRGRELKGKTVALPKDVRGLVITPGDDNPLHWEVTGEFDAMTLWQHDLPPEEAHLEDYLDFLEVASAVHS